MNRGKGSKSLYAKQAKSRVEEFHKQLRIILNERRAANEF